MAAVTQTITNYLGGVSKQTDKKKLPGQVRECINAYPDPTFGLRKRPGLKFINTIHTSASPTSPELADNKWFFIKRDDDEKYVGTIYDNERIRVWDSTGTECTVHDSTYGLTIGSATGDNGTDSVTKKVNLAVVPNDAAGLQSTVGSGMTVNVISKPATISTVVTRGQDYTGGTDIATTGGTGTGLTVDTTTHAGALKEVSIVTPSTGYTSGTGLATVATSGSGSTATVDIEVSTGTGPTGSSGITLVEDVGRFGYTTATDVATIGGSGDGNLTVDITAAPGYLSSITHNPGAGGSGYPEGKHELQTTTMYRSYIAAMDVGDVVSGATGGTRTAGTYTVTVPSSWTTGSGVNNSLILDITINSSNTVTAVAINGSNSGKKYAVGDVITIPASESVCGGLAIVIQVDTISGATGLKVSYIANSSGAITDLQPTGSPIDWGLEGAGGYNVDDVLRVSGGTKEIEVSGIVGKLTAVSVNTAGNDAYKVGDIISINQSAGAGQTGTFKIDSVVGAITGITINNPGNTYAIDDEFTITQGSATAGKAKVKNNTTPINTITINNPGENYTKNDVITIPGGDNTATFTIATVVAKALYVCKHGTGYAQGDTLKILAATHGGSTDIKFTLSTKPEEHYLNTTRDNYHALTVQDTTIITNKTKKVKARGPTGYVVDSEAEVIIRQVQYRTKYQLTLNIEGSDVAVTAVQTRMDDDYPSNSDDQTDNGTNNVQSLCADDILTALKTNLEAASLPSGYAITVEKFNGSLYVKILKNSARAPFKIVANDDQGNSHIIAYNDLVLNAADLPGQTMHGRTIRIINSDAVSDAYWAKFLADDGVKGKGRWEETVDPTVSPGLDAKTLPHELRSPVKGEFYFQEASWADRTTGDLVTNPEPSFVNNPIQQVFFHNNRMGMLTGDNVTMSQTKDFFNFYFTTALTTSDADPIDINCSSIKPAILHAVIPTAQGLILFSRNQQFVMFADAGILTPAAAIIRGISNYETDDKVLPVDVGTGSAFVSKTPSYTRVFAMQTRGQEQSPIVDDIGKVVAEWIPDTVTDMISSPQNAIISLYGTGDKSLYMFKVYKVEDKTAMQSWFKWDLPGKIQHATVEQDTLWTVVEYNGKYVLASASLTQTTEEKIIINSLGQQVNPHMDLYGSISSMDYDEANNLTKCYLPTNLKDNTDLTPILVIAGNGTTNFDGVTESGFTITPDRPTGQTNETPSPYFEVKGKNLTGLTASDIVVGYKYNFDIELPRTYFKQDPDGRIKDYAASLIISRMKFAVGLSSSCGFKVKSKGRHSPYETFTGVGTTFINNFITFKDITGGSGYTTATGLSTTGGNGTGLKVDITANSSGAITAVTASGDVPGGYNPDETITIVQTGGSSGTCKIDTLWNGERDGPAGDHVVKNVETTNFSHTPSAITHTAGGGPGQGYYGTLDDPIIPTGGSGSGLQIRIQVDHTGKMASVWQILKSGVGYKLNDTLTIPKDSTAFGTAFTNDGTFTILTQGGDGTGMTVDVTMKDGVATSVAPNTEGVNYTNGDTVVISKTKLLTQEDVYVSIDEIGTTEFPFNLDYIDSSDLKVKVNGSINSGFSINHDADRDVPKLLKFTIAPDDGDEILLYTDNWYSIQPVQDPNQYLLDDVPLEEETVFTVPLHQNSDNFNIRVFSNSPFPVSLSSMMWEGQYSPRFYRRT